MAVSHVDVSVPAMKGKPVCFFFLLLFTAFVGWSLVFFTSGLCWDWRGQNRRGWEGLLAGKPPEGISVFIKREDGTSAFTNCTDPVVS